MKRNILFYIIGIFTILGLKIFYSNAGSEELFWILAPTTKWVSILTGIPFHYDPGEGYVNHQLLYVIAPSCSGVQFMMITTAMLIFSFVRFMPSFRSGLYWTLGSLLASYVLTIPINALRIILLFYLPDFFEVQGYYNHIITPERLHTGVGVVVYFTALLVIYRLALRLCNRISGTASQTPLWGKCLLPAFWYFAIVLGLPFLNNAYGKNPEGFSEYTLLIIIICAAILAFFGLLSRIRRYCTTAHSE